MDGGGRPLMTSRLYWSVGGLKLVHVNSPLADIFKYSGFDKLFTIETV